MTCNYYLGRVLDTGAPDPRFAGPSPEPQYVPDRNFKTVHVKLELDIDTEKKNVAGTCTATLKSLNGKNELILAAAGFKVLSVRNGKGRPLKYKHENSRLEIKTDKTEPGKIITVSAKYRITRPKLGIYFVGPDKFYPKKPVHVWSHSETEDARYWFPSQNFPDDKSTSETIITVPKGMTVISNGILAKSSDNKHDGTRTFHWKMTHPHSSYLINFVAGDFAEIKDEWKGVKIGYYCEKGREDEIKRAFGKTPEILEFFSDKIGFKYPYEKYAQIAVADFIFGGMEHTTSTTQTDDVLHDERAHEEAKYISDGLCAHELAHQWFGNLVTCKEWSHAWLNESFATYFDGLFVKHDKGKDSFDYEMRLNARDYFDEDKESYRRPIVTNLYKRTNDLFDRHLYQKGACVLRMLHALLGDNLWWASINNYIENNKNKAVETTDLVKSIEEATGMNMKKFFDQWVFGPGHPEYTVLYHWDEKTKEANVRISQTQTPSLFSVKMRIEITTRNGVKHFEENVNNREHLFKYKVDQEPLMVRVDPDNVILKKIEYVKPRKMWIYQLVHDPNAIGRITAAAEIEKYGTEEDAEILGEAMLKEKFWGVKNEIAASLGKMRSRKALGYLVKGLKDENPMTRRAAVAALGNFRNPEITDHVKSLLDDKKSYIVPAEACRTIGRTKDASSIALLKKMLERDSWLDMIRAGAIEGISYIDGEDSVKILQEYSKPGKANRTRLFAIRRLAEIGKGRKDVLTTLTDLIEDDFALVQIEAARALGKIRDERAVPVLEKLTKGDADGRLKRAAEDSIKKIYPWLETDYETYKVTQEVKRKIGKAKVFKDPDRYKP